MAGRSIIAIIEKKSVSNSICDNQIMFIEGGFGSTVDTEKIEEIEFQLLMDVVELAGRRLEINSKLARERGKIHLSRLGTARQAMIESKETDRQSLLYLGRRTVSGLDQ